MTLQQLRDLVVKENLDGQTVLCGADQFTQWMADMPCIERFTDRATAELGFPSVYSQLQRPRVNIVLYGSMHPDESHVVKDWDGK